MLGKCAICLTALLLSATTLLAASPPLSLADAVEEMDRDAIQALLDQRTDVNATQPDGMTALHWAAYRDNLETAKLLLKVANPIERDLITGTLASALQLDREVVQRAYARAASAGGRGGGGGPHVARAPGDPGEMRDARTPPPAEEVEVIALLTDHPSLLPSAEEHGVLSLLTDASLRDMYSATLSQGTPLVELAPLHLPTTTAQLILAGRYAQLSDPATQLSQMTANLRHRQDRLAHEDLLRRLADAKRRGDNQLAGQLATEVMKTRKQVD